MSTATKATAATKAKASGTTARLRVRQVASTIGRAHPQERVIRGLGLRGRGTSVVVDNTPSFRGMIKKVMHLVTVEEEKS